MGQTCCRPSRPSTTSTSSMTDNLTSSYNAPTPTPYAVKRPSSPVNSLNITKCPECYQLTSTLYWNWCKRCSARHFSDNFSNWSSGNPNLDKLIQEIQLNATYSEQVIEWIPYERFRKIKYISKGGFGEVMYSEWEDGQIYNWDTSTGMWKRRGRHPVALKRIKGSEECPEDFLNEVRSLHSITRQNLSFEVTHCFGISQDPTTKEYIMVISYAENGSLCHYLMQHPNIDWSTRICYLLKITQGLDVIHGVGLIHRDFHSGNILMGKRYPMVSDFGLSRYVGRNNDNNGIADNAIPSDNSLDDGDNNSIFGVIPYIAPEVLKGHPYTPASDIYSFGMIMYELLTGHQPFHDTAHDLELITKITSVSVDNRSSLATSTSALNSTTALVPPPALSPYKTAMPSSSPYVTTGINPNNSTSSLSGQSRPSLYNIQHPKCWIRLMRRCWNDDPTQRPTTAELKEELDKWYQLMETNVARNREDLEILRDFRDAENFRVDSHERNSMSGSSINSGKLANNNSTNTMGTREKHYKAYYYSRKIPTIKLVRKLEEQMGMDGIQEYINSQYLRGDPSIDNSSRSDLGKNSLMIMSTANNPISSPYLRQSNLPNNTTEDRSNEKSGMGTPNRRDSNLGKGVVGGVVEMLRDMNDSYEVEGMIQTDSGDLRRDANARNHDFWNSSNIGLESSYSLNSDSNALSQKSGAGTPNNSDPLILRDENQLSSEINIGNLTLGTTRNPSFNGSNLIGAGDATSNTRRNNMNYF